jgi:outer membrane protein assembly factor BamB
VIVAVGGRIYNLDQATGNLKWRYPAGESIAGNFTSGAVVAGDTVLAAGDDKSIYAVDLNTGKLKWQYLSPSPITSNLVVLKDNIAFVANKQALTIVALQSGAAIGKPNNEASLIHDDIQGFGDQVIYTTQRGKMVSFDASTMRAKWEQQLNLLKPSGNFTLFNDRIYVNSGNFLICMRASTGSAIWQENVGRDLIGKPAASDSGIGVLDSRGGLGFYNTNGRPVFGKPLQIGVPAGSPSYLGEKIVIPTANGAINLVDPKSGTIIWSYVISPIVVRTAPATGGGAAAGGGNSDGGIGAIGGGGAPGASGTLQAQGNQGPIRTYTLVSGTPAMSGNSLFVLTRDASLLMFDKELGVDMTPPRSELLWPTPGNEVAGKAPMEMIFRLEDFGIGINPDSVKVTINDKEYFHRLTNDGYISVLIVSNGANAQIANGRATIKVTAADWLGNTATQVFNLVIDNSLPAIGGPPREGTTNQGGGAGGGGARGGGLGGGL